MERNKKYIPEEVIEKAEELSYLPNVVAKLMEMVSDPDATVQDIIGVIKKDQGLVARVYKVANSSFYGRMKRAEHLTEAVVTLGLRGLKSLVISQAVKHVLTSSGADDSTLWDHATKVSLASAVVANVSRYPIIDDALIGGLVHDIGKAFIGNAYPEIRSLIYQKVEHGNETHEDMERNTLGFDHTLVGAMIAEKWVFPQNIVDVIRYHHSEAENQSVIPESCKLIHIVRLADVISKQYGEQPDVTTMSLLEKLQLPEVQGAKMNCYSHLLEEIKAKWRSDSSKNFMY